MNDNFIAFHLHVVHNKSSHRCELKIMPYWQRRPVATCHAEHLWSLFEAFGLKIGVSGPTHRDGGVPDLVAACDAVPVSIVCVDRSDHSLLHWLVTSDRPTIPSVTVRSRSWRRLDVDLFRSRLASSDLCLPSSWQADVDASASLYNGVITGILDEILPARLGARRP